MDLTELAREIHADNVAAGWWPDEDKSKRYDTCLMLIVSELAEAMEGDRKNLMDDHLTDLPMFQVELADAAIRLLDLGGAVFSSHPNALPRDAWMDRWDTLELQLTDLQAPEQLLFITKRVVHINSIEPIPVIAYYIAQIFCALYVMAGIHDFDLLAVIERKREYNRTRADHSKAARAGANGKRY